MQRLRTSNSVPALFRQWPRRVIAAACVQLGERVLDVACGTGILAREVAAVTGPAGFVAGVDLNPGMLTVARRLAPVIEWREGSAEALPYPDGAFDAVVSQFGLMFFADRRQALREMLRVLVPGGRLAVAVWDSLDNTPAYRDLVGLLERTAGARPADALRAPFALGDRDELRALFVSAGVDGVEITTHQGTARFPSVRSMVEAELRGWLPVVGIVLPDEQINQILEQANQVLKSNVAEGTAFDCPAHIVAGKKSKSMSSNKVSRK